MGAKQSSAGPTDKAAGVTSARRWPRRLGITAAGLLAAAVAVAPVTAAAAPVRPVDIGSSRPASASGWSDGSQPASAPGWSDGSQPASAPGWSDGSQPASAPGWSDGNGWSGNGWSGNRWSGRGWSGGGWSGSGQAGRQGSAGGSTTGGATTGAQAATAAESHGVVLINTRLYDGSQAAGTGIVLTSAGRVLTNYHVVEGSTSVRVTVATTGRTYTARVVGADQSADVALLQLSGAHGLTTATIDRDPISVGDGVTAVGNAGGTGELSAADGTVTALKQRITTAAEGPAAGERLTGLIETDAGIVAGDSGGPLLDSQGEVAGIDTAASSGGQVDGYAVPIKDALSVVATINSGNQTAAVRIGPAAYLGVQVTDAATADSSSGYGYGYGYGYGGSAQAGSPSTGAGSGSGAAVSAVVAGGPAATAGITAGDVITRLGSTDIGSVDDLTQAVKTHQPGQQVRVGWTDTSGRQHTGTVTLGSSPVN